MNQTGTIELDKQADILILSANPIENIENTKSIDSVISNGRIIERSDLSSDWGEGSETSILEDLKKSCEWEMKLDFYYTQER
jgi:hypothetical protein